MLGKGSEEDIIKHICRYKKAHLSIAGVIPVQDGLPAAVQIIKLLLRDRIIDVHSRDAKLASFGELVKPNRMNIKTQI